MNYSEFGKLESVGWSDHATVDSYVASFARATDMAIGPIVKASGAGSGKRVLDLCCGHGAGIEALLAVGAEVTGLDFSPAMLSQARSRAEAAELIEGDAQSLPFSDGTFDAVVCAFGMMHVPDQPKALSEVHRVLRPGGIFVMTAWCGPDRSHAFRIAFGSIQAHGDPQTSLPPAPDFHRLADPATAEALLSDAGFRNVQSSTIECAYEFDQPDGLWKIFSLGTVRAKMLIDAQPQANREAIRRAMVEAVDDRFHNGSRLRVPAPAALVSAQA
ncbi:class I SAM-dependent methyltransferase [Roseibium salinum]|uniref:Methyltransferase domain-containing protein n=1 Tax=Roseibium salinum TaxID=1604349 RepID=A0ABT3QVN0_9HYPH|nr:methyltransferase domain-containing protein [Roseibium sp. DSM 29163]MCX2720970.1 methyltransferase domain-containing protein [Roseibium sp. DSM 29163]MDN3722435.1 methyltransferase domain-containing protein [Roseibium salinum]